MGRDRTALAELAGELAVALRGEVLPLIGSHEGRRHVGEAGASGSGDVTFEIDARAESLLERFLAQHAPDVAFYSEDRGMVADGSDPEWVLIVDPIDGTRPAMAGLESACVSIAAARLEGEPTMVDVEVAWVVEIKSGAAFRAERGSGLDPRATLSGNRDLGRMFWTYGLRGRPVRPMAEVLADLIDAASVGGAAFELGSASYDMTRIATGQLDAYVEPGPRLVADVAGMRAEFERVGGGAILNNSPYDLAAAALCLEEAGALVTDAYGKPIGNRRLLGSSPEYQISCIAAANQDLHRQICMALDAGMDRLARLADQMIDPPEHGALG
jgi:myo-inositol-1(or 4)-monophosphatase